MRRLVTLLSLLSFTLVGFAGCSLERSAVEMRAAADSATQRDGSELDGGRLDGSELDGGRLDGSELDGAELDSGASPLTPDGHLDRDSGPMAVPDSGVSDLDSAVSALDSGTGDGAVADSGSGADAAVQTDSGTLDSGTPDGGCAPAGASCVDGVRTRCEAGRLSTTMCALGCSTSTAGECVSVVPSNVTSIDFADGTHALTIPSGETWIFDTDDGSIDRRIGETVSTIRAAGVGAISSPEGTITFAIEDQTGGPELAVFAVGSLAINGRLELRGETVRSLVILSEGPILIGSSGHLVVSSRGYAGGGEASRAGGGAGGAEAPNGLGTTGGGGGSYGSLGGRGGMTPPLPILGGAPGELYGNETLIPLVPGSGGAAPRASSYGGRGGGAVQLASNARIASLGVIEANGQGGQSGIQATGGGGGGSGGAILLEAPTVTLGGHAVWAVGGGGGRGAACNTCTDSGSPGTTAEFVGGTQILPEGAEGQGFGGGGSDGSVSNVEAENGRPAGFGGGGGGGAGRIRINTATGTSPILRELAPSRSTGLATLGTLQVQ